jgi:hypothetical protein
MTRIGKLHPLHALVLVMASAAGTGACDGEVNFGRVHQDGGASDGSGGTDGTLGPDVPAPPPDADSNIHDAGSSVTEVEETSVTVTDAADGTVTETPDTGLDSSQAPESASNEAAVDSPVEAADDGPVEGGDDTLSGHYTGYIESFAFDDGSDVVSLDLSLQPDDSITGTVYFAFADGGAPLPPATDPNVGYPPALGPSRSNLPDIYEGFFFTMQGGTYTAPRVQLSIRQAELWTQWCAIQTPVAKYANATPDASCGVDLYAYGCLGDVGYSMNGGFPATCTAFTCQDPTPTPIDCLKLGLCSTVLLPTGSTSWPTACACTATGCTAALVGSAVVAFDMRFGAGALNGSVTAPDGQVHNVYLTRVP